MPCWPRATSSSNSSLQSPELVYIILDAAQYWVSATSLREQYARIDASVLHPDISLCYLVTPPILDGCTHKGETIHLRVVIVEFTMFSRDRGGSDYQDTYPEYSWFEAAILRLSQAPDAVPWITSAANAPVELDSTMGYDPKLEVQGAGPNGDKSRWPQCAVASESSHGAGDGEGFVTRLRAGDRIGVIVRARCAGWSNVVKFVEVSVAYSLV
ncbi:hypothetical protein DFH06DRAFT_1328001 [Mycena polygramma]|nr:hypothetical protein DFH06DRAFT_1328001 [Mycena polygramma]